MANKKKTTQIDESLNDSLLESGEMVELCNEEGVIHEEPAHIQEIIKIEQKKPIIPMKRNINVIQRNQNQKKYV